jgi:hypothetical protein
VVTRLKRSEGRGERGSSPWRGGFGDDGGSATGAGERCNTLFDVHMPRQHV